MQQEESSFKEHNLSQNLRHYDTYREKHLKSNLNVIVGLMNDMLRACMKFMISWPLFRNIYKKNFDCFFIFISHQIITAGLIITARLNLNVPFVTSVVLISEKR